MVSKYSYKKELNRRIVYSKKRNNYLIISLLHRDKLLFVNKISSTLTKIRNRCVETGCSRSVLGKYKMGRIYFKKAASSG